MLLLLLPVFFTYFNFAKKFDVTLGLEKFNNFLISSLFADLCFFKCLNNLICFSLLDGALNFFETSNQMSPIEVVVMKRPLFEPFNSI